MSSKRAKEGVGLNEQQRLFCAEYIKDLNGSAAAIRAGYGEAGARVQASRMLANPNIAQHIQDLFDKRAKRVEVDGDTILRELLAMATVDVTEAFDEAGWLKQLKDIPPNVRKSIQGLETQELFQGEGEERSIIGLSRKLKFYDKTKALELLGKHLKLFTDRVEHSGSLLEQIVGAAQGKQPNDG